jgi:hypothetical protein
VAGLAADNLVVALYFAFLFYKAQAGPDTSAEAATAVAAKKSASSSTNSSTNSSPNGSSSSSKTSSSSSTNSSTNGGNALLSKDSLAYSLTLACALTAAGTALAEGLLKGRISAIPITTLLTVAGASLRPQVCYTLYHVSFYDLYCRLACSRCCYVQLLLSVTLSICVNSAVCFSLQSLMRVGTMRHQ